MGGNLTQFIQGINITDVQQEMINRTHYFDLSDFWQVKEYWVSLFGDVLYVFFWLTIVGVAMIKTKRFDTGAYLGVLLGIAIAQFIPTEAKYVMYGLVAFMLAAIILKAILRR